MTSRVLPKEHFDQGRLRELDGLPGDLMIDLMQIFVETTPKHIDSIELAIGQGCGDALWRSAHALKSCSLNIGATKLAQLSTLVESFGKEARVLDATALLPKLIKEHEVILAIFQSQLKNKL